MGDDMTDRFRMFGLSLLLAGITMLPSAKADEWNKETLVTFSTPVAVPGQVLAPGRYVFKLADSQSDRHIVQIFTEEPREIVATVVAIPAYRLTPSGDTLVTFEERPAGTPEAVKRWFYPGDLSGVAFVYPEDQQ
jgi:hypothetical protein